MKNSIVIFLLLIFSFNIGGVLGIFKMQQIEIRRAVKKQIELGVDVNGLEIIRIHSKNESLLSWEEENEFTYHGNMYDVFGSKMEGDSVKIYYCIKDSKETTLFASLNDSVKKNIDTNSPGNQTVKKMLKSLLEINVKQNEKSGLTLLHSPTFAICIHPIYTSPEIGSSYPPPRKIFA